VLQSPAHVAEHLRDFCVVTCEHGGNRIPTAYVDLFHGWQARLSSHQGYDAGALIMARDLAAALQAPRVVSTVSRLLVDLNRSLSSPQAWWEATLRLSPTSKQVIVSRHYTPYRQRLMEIVVAAVAAGRRVIHVSSHSFTPVLDGQVRNADVGLLYDPARPGEVAVAARWKAAFAAQSADLRVRRNYPYHGKNDGLTAAMRARLSTSQYVGIEIELNQVLISARSRSWRNLRRTVVTTLESALR